MPCYDGRDNYSWEDGQRDVQQVKNDLVPKLCHACTILEHHGLIPVELEVWWSNHKEEDAKRLAADRAKAKAANEKRKRDEYLESIRERLRRQLSPEELEAIGMS